MLRFLYDDTDLNIIAVCITQCCCLEVYSEVSWWRSTLELFSFFPEE